MIIKNKCFENKGGGDSIPIKVYNDTLRIIHDTLVGGTTDRELPKLIPYDNNFAKDYAGSV